jgi:hypothetical protein
MICKHKPPIKRYPQEQVDPILNNTNAERPPQGIKITKKKQPKEKLFIDET